MAATIKWTHVMKQFVTLWENLTTCEEIVQVPTSRTTKELPIIKQVEVSGDYLCHIIVGSKNTLIYVVHILVPMPGICILLKNDQPYLEDDFLIDESLNARASHDHGLFPQCSTHVYYML